MFNVKPLLTAIPNQNFLSSRDIFYGLESVYVFVSLLCTGILAYCIFLEHCDLYIENPYAPENERCLTLELLRQLSHCDSRGG